MPEARVMKQGVEQATKELLQFLLESGRVSAVLALGRTGDNGDDGVAYSLFTDPDAFGADGVAQPLLPSMPANAGGLLSRLTLKGSLSEPIAAVVRPCELRAFVELVKFNQASLDNVLLISSTCNGVYPLDMDVNGDRETYWQTAAQGELNADVRPTCQACLHFVPQNADVTISLLGEAHLDDQCTLYLNTEKGVAFLDGLETVEKIAETAEPTPSIQHVRRQREAYRESLFAGVEVGLQGLINTFGRCISCRACKTVCPICYCHLCYFDSQDCERSLEFYELELARKGGLRVPTDTVFFQLGRLAHMSVCCVGCGMCTDVCPADIPVSTIFSKVGATVQDLFDYEPGKDLEEEIPLRTFMEEEFPQVAT